MARGGHNAGRSLRCINVNRASDAPVLCGSHRNAYAPIQAVVTFHPFFQVMISSILSCSQNTGPLFAANLRKLAVVMGNDRGSFVESKPGCLRGVFGEGLGIAMPEARMADAMLNGTFVGVVGGSCCGADGETEV